MNPGQLPSQRDEGMLLSPCQTRLVQMCQIKKGCFESTSGFQPQHLQHLPTALNRMEMGMQTTGSSITHLPNPRLPLDLLRQHQQQQRQQHSTCNLQIVLSTVSAQLHLPQPRVLNGGLLHRQKPLWLVLANNRDLTLRLDMQQLESLVRRH